MVNPAPLGTLENNFDTLASSGISISVMPLLPQRFSANMAGARLANNNETGLPIVTPAQSRPTLQQVLVQVEASNDS
jgi:hypothetical protein